MLFSDRRIAAPRWRPRGKNLPGQGKILRPSRGLLFVRLPSIGLVAQLVEQCPFKALVQGSSPCQPTNLPLTFRSRLRGIPTTSQMATKVRWTEEGGARRPGLGG